jgi:hypothetical protein
MYLAAFNRLRMASEGAVQTTIEYMKLPDNDIIARQYCAMTLGNLAAEPENHAEIVKSQGINYTITDTYSIAYRLLMYICVCMYIISYRH